MTCISSFSQVNRSIMENITRVIEKKLNDRLALGNDDSFSVLDLDDVTMKYRKWVEKLPRVFPHYAMKCNNDARIIKVLADAGAGFDCASRKEIEQILELGVNPGRIIFAHTVKQVSHLKFAAAKNVRKVTFDTAGELDKIKKFHPRAQAVLRIRFDAKYALVSLGSKFGCEPEQEAPRLIKMCKNMNVDLIGISFHVGSGCQEVDIFRRALKKVSELFDFAKTLGLRLNFVDIGGGFAGQDINQLDEYAAVINKSIEEHFSDPSIKIISEPGRYFVDSSSHLAVQVVMKKIDLEGKIHYYINEGVHMSFMIFQMYGEKFTFSIIRKSECSGGSKLSNIWGSSCNTKDKVMDEAMIPEMNTGDWIVFHNMGAYTTSLSSSFNGFEVGDVYELRSLMGSKRSLENFCEKSKKVKLTS